MLLVKSFQNYVHINTHAKVSWLHIFIFPDKFFKVSSSSEVVWLVIVFPTHFSSTGIIMPRWHEFGRARWAWKSVITVFFYYTHHFYIAFMYNGKGHVKQMIRGFQSQGKEVPASACKFFFFLPDRFHAHFSTLVIYEMVAATLAIGTYYSQKSSL